jgi:predicted aminopeptidase
MVRTRTKRGNFRKWALVGLLIVIGIALSGCQTFSFYSQAFKGQYQIIVHRQPLEKVMAAPETPSPLRAKLQLVQDLRTFAEKELKLPVDGHYAKYVDVHRRFVVWNVEAAREFSLEPKTWWYPLVGSLEYRGYFSERGATNYGKSLERKDYDVYVAGVEAYSTLGWFKDPVLNTFINNPGADLAETIFHELGHQRVFARSDTDFNEAFATTVGQEGARRWLRAKGNTNDYEHYVGELRRNSQFVHLIMSTRERLLAIYGDELTPAGRIKATNSKRALPREDLRLQKQEVLKDLQRQYAQLKAQWGGIADYDQWFSNHVNNAQLNSVAAYHDLVPGFEHLLELNGGALEPFYEAAQRLAKKPRKDRHEWLRTLGQGSGMP